jgi:multiple sugar transport system permease protein
MLVLFGSFLMLLPFLWMFATSLRPASESMKLPPQFFPNQFQYKNYVDVLHSNIPFFGLVFNSMKISIIITSVQIVTCSTSAYAFARLRFPGRNVLFAFLLCTLMVPIHVMIIPLFIGFNRLGLSNTHWTIILPYLTNVFGVFLLRQFFVTLPRELEESAKIDGAGPYRTFLFIVIPQSGPMLAALTIMTFNSSWNNYFTPLVFISDWRKMTLPLGIAALRGYMGSGNLSVVMAGVTLAMVPVLFVFFGAQRFFIQSLSMSGIKG